MQPTKIFDLLSGTKTLETTHSKYNGEIKVIRDFTWGTHIVVNGLTQSGGIINSIWQVTLKEVLKKKPKINNCLVLGLGGGTCTKLVSQYWVNSKITGIDIDKKIVDLGMKYLRLDKNKINIIIQDAAEFSGTFDLIIVDLYSGGKFPQEFEKEEFLKKISNHLNKDGITIFNRLYGGNKRPPSLKFAKKLEKVFKKVDYIYPQANLELICYN